MFHIRSFTIVFFAIAMTLLTVLPAIAHTSFEASIPSDGAFVEDPVTEIELIFSGEAEPTGDKFQVLDASGSLREPSQASSDDGLTWVLVFDPPLVGGVIGTRWNVKAPDAHPIEGAFSFTVEAEAAPVVELAPVSSPEASVNEGPDTGAELIETPPADESQALAAFLEADGEPTVANRVGIAGRMLSISGALVGLGALVFAGLVLRGHPSDIRHVMYWVRRSGVIVIAGAIVEVLAQVSIEGGGGLWTLTDLGVIVGVLGSSFGVAVLLRLIGGVGLTYGARFSIAHAADKADPVVAIRDLVGVGSSYTEPHPALPMSHHPGEPYSHPHDSVWHPDGTAVGALIGAVALMASFLFDGHTVTEGHRWFTAVLDIVHVGAGAIWAGGVTMLASVAWNRHRQERPARAAQMALRFSVVATFALVAVGAAGLALTIIILDSFSELFTTPWGRLLLAKMALVGVAAAAGGYNHKVLIPKLHAHGDRHGLPEHFRQVVTIEGALVLAVGIVTALLVGAAS